MYYSAGLLSKKDIYPEHKSSVLKSEESRGVVREKKDKSRAKEGRVARRRKKKASEEEAANVLKTTIKTEPGVSSTPVGEAPDLVEAPPKLSTISIKKEPTDFHESADFSFESDVEGSVGLFSSVIETGSVLQSPSPGPSISPSPLTPSPHPSPKGKKKKERIKKEKNDKKVKSKKDKGPPSVKALIAQRRKLWVLTCKKEISKVRLDKPRRIFQN